MERHRRSGPPPHARQIQRAGDDHPSVRRISAVAPSDRADVTDAESGQAGILAKGTEDGSDEAIQALANEKTVSDQ